MKTEDKTIPKDMSYSEEFLLGLSVKNFFYLAVGVVLMYLVIFQTESIIPEFWIRLAMSFPIVILLVFLIIFRLDEKIKDQMNFNKSIRDSSYFDSKMKSFVELAEITDDMVLLKNGVMLAILEVKPIDFSILSTERQEAIIKTYQNWLNSVDYPVQILSRSSEVNINKWLDNLEKNENMQGHSKYFKEFKQWIIDELETRSTRNRVFYIVIPQFSRIKTNSVWNEMKSLVTGNYYSSLVDKESKRFQDNVKQLAISVRNCEDVLRLCDLKVTKLDTSELMGLYTTYFTNSSIINRTLLNPLMWMDPKSEQAHDALWKRMNKNEN